ncbi:MAG TPA: hypothetical protein VF412_08680 [Bdellovibrio sp.]|uniref:hypothetical protein n=1 Tax=Bdellovibrio sp. TaxID=28201 RepID=UPI002EE88283
MKILCSILLTLIPMSSFAAFDPATCPDKVERNGSIQIQQTVSGDNNGCFLSVHNFKQDTMVYRDFLFTTEGEFMVFNSFGNGPEDQFTGAREYYMFPRTSQGITYKWNEETRHLDVTDMSGTVYSFDYEDGSLTSMTKAQVKSATDVVDTNKGGVEITKFQGVLLDIGFAKGHAPSAVHDGIVTFTDASGQTCKAKNSDIFSYTADGDNTLKFTDKALAAFLVKKCPKFKFPLQ